jgi:hypothetical protein
MFAKTPTVKKSILADTIEENVYNSFKRPTKTGKRQMVFKRPMRLKGRRGDV